MKDKKRRYQESMDTEWGPSFLEKISRLRHWAKGIGVNVNSWRISHLNHDQIEVASIEGLIQKKIATGPGAAHNGGASLELALAEAAARLLLSRGMAEAQTHLDLRTVSAEFHPMQPKYPLKARAELKQSDRDLMQARLEQNEKVVQDIIVDVFDSRDLLRGKIRLQWQVTLRRALSAAYAHAK